MMAQRKWLQRFRTRESNNYNTGKNLGGAGGFAFGLRKAIELGYLYAWIMDDELYPGKRGIAKPCG